MTNRFLHFLCFLTIISLVSCSPAKHLTTGTKRSIVKAWQKSGFDKDHHTGLSIHDLEKGEEVISYRANNYFTSASNTKLLTLYAALQTLDDTLDAVRYVEDSDSIFIWGCGDPGTLYPNIDTTCSIIEFIANSKKPIVISENHFKAKRFGPGWAWDDYPYAFQCERTALPAFGNRIWVSRVHDSIRISPQYLEAAFSIQKGSSPKHGKTEWGDAYYYTYSPNIKSESFSIPITFFANDMRYTWAEITGKNIFYSERQLPAVTYYISGSLRDSLLRQMMVVSDNFIAEQLLLACSMVQLDYMSDKDIIQHIQEKYLFNLPDKPKWFDGSGLSRYNALTPASIQDILQRIYSLKGLSFITDIFPDGGKTGTLKDEFSAPNGESFIYAKSGSLKNIYNLSGYLITKSGKVLSFSWMNNSLNGTSSDVKAKMEDFLLYVYNHY